MITVWNYRTMATSRDNQLAVGLRTIRPIDYSRQIAYV
jgi:hypothetical protein